MAGTRRRRKENTGPVPVRYYDYSLVAVLVFLVCFGLVMLYSTSAYTALIENGDSMYYFKRQILFCGAGFVIIYVVSRINYHWYIGKAKAIYFFSLFLMLLVKTPLGKEVNGARRWIQLPLGQQFQPSEVAKFSLICMMAAMAAQYKEKMADFRYGVVRMGGVMLLILALVALEKHLSAIMIIGIVSVVMMYVGGTKKRWLFLAMGLAVVFLVLYVSVMGYAGDRITAWLNPEADAQDKGYQVLQSQYAIGSGGLFGLGFGMGRQKHLYLPEEHNDYIFAIVCEELGLIGAVGIIILFALLIIRGYWIAMHAADRFSTMLAVGITTLLAVQVVLNMGVVSNLLPSTGVGLPFFSYGGTNLMMNLGEMGIMLSISRWSSSTRG